MVLKQWEAIAITFIITCLIIRIFIEVFFLFFNEEGKVRPRCKILFVGFGFFFLYFALFCMMYITSILVFLALGGLVKIEGYNNYNTPIVPPAATAATTLVKKFNNYPPPAFLSIDRNYTFTIMNFDKSFPTYNWSNDEPFDVSGGAFEKGSHWSLKVWNIPEEKVRLELNILIATTFYNCFYELSIINRDIGVVTFSQSGFGRNWWEIEMPKEGIMDSLDKYGILHFMMSLSTLGNVTQGVVQRIWNKEGK
jgi:hypothetical protein